MILKQSIEQLMRGENLTAINCQHIIDEILNPDANTIQIAALLVLLHSKGETAEELFAIISSLRSRIKLFTTNYPTLDIVGTGGDGFNTINISTGSAILAASCGVKIAKHGNRSVSSLTGSADVLEALNINIHLSAEKISTCIDKIGIGFYYSPNFHQATLSIKQLRQQLNVPTAFNYVGPFLNPSKVEHMIIGVADPMLLDTMAEILKLMNINKSIIVHGMGLDEISCVGPMKIIEIFQSQKKEYLLDPKKFGLAYCNISDLRGGNAKTNAQLLLDAFTGKKGPIADTLALNAAMAAYIYGLYSSIDEALVCAQNNLAKGEAIKLLNNWRKLS